MSYTYYIHSQANSCGTKQIDEDKLLDLVRTLPGKGMKGPLAGKSTPAKKPAKKASVKQLLPKQSSPPLQSPEQQPMADREPPPPQLQSGSATPKAALPQSHVTTPVSMATPPQGHVSSPMRTPVEGECLPKRRPTGSY